MLRRLYLALSMCTLLTAAAHAETFPARPITLIVPWPPGGSADSQMRVLATEASRHLGQPVVVVNRPGAAGSMGAVAVAVAKPDGYTITQTPTGVFRQPHINKMAYDPRKDLTYIIGTTKQIHGVVVRGDSPWKSFRELIAYGKANPGKLRYATHTVGSPQHVAIVTIGQENGIDWQNIPHKGTAENNTALLGGVVEFTSDGTGWSELVKAGKFRLLVISGDQRAKAWPDVPTYKELGFKAMEIATYGIAAPKGTPPEIVARLHEAFHKAMESPEHLKVLDMFQMRNNYMSAADYTAYANVLYEEQGEIVRKFGLNQDARH